MIYSRSKGWARTFVFDWLFDTRDYCSCGKAVYGWSLVIITQDSNITLGNTNYYYSEKKFSIGFEKSLKGVKSSKQEFLRWPTGGKVSSKQDICSICEALPQTQVMTVFH